MSKTYERIFGRRVVNVNGHAYRNALHVRALVKVDLEVKKMFKDLK